MVDEDFRDGRFGLAFGQFELSVLEIHNRAAKCFALFDVGHRLTQGAFDHADALDTDNVALLRELLHQLDETLALFWAEQG